MTLSAGEFLGQPAEWDSFVRQQHGWTHFHLFGWKRVIEQVFGHECLYLSVAVNGELRGVLPLVRVRSRLFGHFLVSMPFVNYGGPLGEADAIEALTSAAMKLSDTSNATLLELRSRGRQQINLDVSHRKISVLLDLPPDPAALFGSFKAKVRSQVRRPQKEGVDVRFGPTQLSAFYDVFAHHMRDLGTPVQSIELFRALAREFPEDIWFGAAYLDDVPIAGGCGFRWGSEFEMTWASSLRAYNHIAPNMLLYWGFMERAIQDGAAVFNFGRCTSGSGTHRFKRQWGTRDEQLHWYHFGGGQGGSTPSPDQGRYAWGPRLWRHLPLGITKAVGPRVVRFIP